MKTYKVEVITWFHKPGSKVTIGNGEVFTVEAHSGWGAITVAMGQTRIPGHIIEITARILTDEDATNDQPTTQEAVIPGPVQMPTTPHIIRPVVRQTPEGDYIVE